MAALVTFDLDNTLWDVDQVIVTAEQAMREWLKKHVPAVVELYESKGLGDIRTRLLASEPGLRHNLSVLRVRVTQHAIEACGYGAEEAGRLAQAAFEVFMDGRHQVVYFDQAIPTLALLSSRYRLAALSNGNANIQRLGLDRYFSFALSAAQVGQAKPHPEIFLAALRRAGAEAANTIHIGDHLDDDIAGAQGVGMHTIWVDMARRGLPDGAPRPSATVNSLSELPAAIAAISASVTRPH